MKEIVIKVPDVMLEIKNWDWMDAEYLIDCVKKGIILPKGHGRLIDADELRPYQFDRNYIHIDELDNAPTVLEANKEI